MKIAPRKGAVFLIDLFQRQKKFNFNWWVIKAHFLTWNSNN